ncbi:MAG TPA: diguanylate cyclase [Symbiobacteriaceae bacterium]|nr:diguanylate cyclase [Symbiobacteriaceae bacterium]
MRRYTPEALWFIAGAAALALTGIWGATSISGPAPSFLALATLTVGACLAHLYPIRSAREGAFYVLSNVFLFAGVELLPPYLFAVLAAAALVPLTWNQRRRPGALIRFVFNASQSTLAMLSAWSIIVMGGALWEGAFAEVGLVLAAIIMFTAVQTGCVAVIIALNSRIPIARVEGIDLISFLSDALMPFLGALVTLVWQSRPAMLFLFLPPLVVVYRLMRNVQLIRQADLDAKTGLYNYSYFVQRMNQTLQYARLVRQPTAVLFADMDLLRDINNTHGHLAGDQAIKHVTTVLLKELPQNATVARFGGEEFVALLPGTDPDEAEFIGWRVCREISRTPVAFGDGCQVRVTASIGVAGYPEHGATVEDLVHAADLAVYHAKARGRDRVISARYLSPEELRESRPDRKAERASHGPAPAQGQAPARVPAPAPAAGSAQPAAAQPPQTIAPADVAPGGQPSTTHPGQKLDLGSLLMIGLISLMALASLGWVLPGALRLSAPALIAIVAASALAELMRLQIPDPTGKSQASISLAVAAVMATGAEWGPPGAILAGLTAAVAHQFIARPKSPAKIAFNLASPVLTSLAAGLVLEAGGRLADPHLLFRVLLCVAAAAANYLTGHLLVSLMIARQSRRRLLEVARSMVRDTAAHYITLGSLGGFMAVSYQHLGLAGASMFVLPAALLYVNFGQRLRQSGARIAGLEQIRIELEAAQRQQKRSLDELVVTLAGIIDARDFSVTGHSTNVARYAEAIAREMGLSDLQADKVRLGGLLHDIGKIGVPEELLNKPGGLSAEEWVVMKNHAALGERLLSQVSQLEGVARMVGEHHERWSGCGYPAGKAGTQISLGGRILTVADALDCMLTERPYSQAKPLAWAFAELERCAGDQFDPAAVQALRRVLQREGAAFFAQHRDGPAAG